MNNNRDTYFAADDAGNLIDKLELEVKSWGTGTTGSSVFYNLLSAYWRNTISFYSSITNPDSWQSSLGYRGDVGELVSMVIPLSKTLVQQYCSLITKQRYNFECISKNTDADPLQTSRIGTAIAESIVEKFQLDLKRGIIAERVSVQGSMFMSSTWRSDKGYMFSRYEDGTFAYSGDCHVEMHDIHEVIYNWSIEEWENVPYVTLKRKRNRWDLVAQYPELKSEILAFPSARSEKSTNPTFKDSDFGDDDMIYVREFYHRATPAVPFGRMVTYLTPECVFFDSDEEEEIGNPYEDENFSGKYGIPVEPFIFNKMHHTCLGVPWYSDLLPCQELFDSNMSAQATNYSSYGVQSTLVPLGADIDVLDIAHGNKFIQYTPQGADGGGKPEPLQLTAPPMGIDNFSNALEKHMGTLSSINETLRGNPPANVTSGAMAATLSASALEFLNSSQRVITLGMERVMNRCIMNYQKFATVEQVVDIIGKSNISYAKKFTGEQIKDIQQLRIREQNPLLATTAGRLQLADAMMPLLQSGNYDAIAKYTSIVEGAPTEMLFETQYNEQMAVQRELDALMEGKSVAPLLIQNHPLYIRGYMSILSDPEMLTRGTFASDIVKLMEARAMLEMKFQQTQPQLFAILRNAPMPQQPQIPQGPPGDAGQAMEPQPTQGAQPATPASPAQPMI